MNTPTITTALPTSSSNPQGTRAGDSREPGADTPTLSSLLTRQQTNEPAPAKTIPVNTEAAPKKGDTQDIALDAAESTDEALAEDVAEQGLSLPQIALNIAAEAALAMAAR